MRRQLDVLRDQFLIQNLKDGLINNEKPLQSPLVSQLRPAAKRLEHREGRSGIDKNDISPNARRYFVEDLGEDMLFMDSSKKSPSQSVAQIQDLPVFHKGKPNISHNITLVIHQYYLNEIMDLN